MTDEWPTLEVGPSLEVAGVERIAVFRALHLGDFLCAVPALRALKERHPRAELTLIGLRWTRSIVGRYAFVDRFLEFPGYWGLEDVPWEPDRTEEFLEEARRCGYDLAVQMHGDGRTSNGFVAQLGARATLGYRPADSTVPQQLDLELVGESGDHEIERWLRLVRVLGARGGTGTEFPLLAEDWVEAERVSREAGLDPGRPVVGLHPGAKDAAKRWPWDCFVEAADRLAESLDAQVVVTGSRTEAALADRIVQTVRAPAFNLAGLTSLGGLAALLARLSLLVTNDTGPSHLAAAVGAPSVVLFGPTDPARWAPLKGCTHRALWAGSGNPISAIPVEWVVAESLALVERCAYLTY